MFHIWNTQKTPSTPAANSEATTMNGTRLNESSVVMCKTNKEIKLDRVQQNRPNSTFSNASTKQPKKRQSTPAIDHDGKCSKRQIVLLHAASDRANERDRVRSLRR